jgi:WD40 repeat protein/serine/threonine protein kinase
MDEQSIFQEALKMPVGPDRDQWLAKACHGDSSLRDRIQQKLAAHFERPEDSSDRSSLEVNPTFLFDSRIDPSSPHQNDHTIDFAKSQEVRSSSEMAVSASSLKTQLAASRVVLRESDVEGPDPISRPSSSEMPKSFAETRYQLQGEIARGGMGAILKGRDVDLGRDLAIKVLLDAHKQKPEVIQRFVEEAQIGGQLQHPGITPIYELGQFSDQRPYFAMKLVKGQTFSKLLSDRKNPLENQGRMLGIFEQVCQTMAYAHSRGVIHRDLKPANIMVGAFGEVQVMDWGLAKVLSVGGVRDEKRAHEKQQDASVIETRRSLTGSDPSRGVGSHTQVGSVMGTPAYMPPEQALGDVHQLDERADVFGLGAILCEILTGKPPYVAEETTRLFQMAMRGRLADCFQRLDSCRADQQLIEITRNCLELEPDDRPRDAGVLAGKITDYLESVKLRLREIEMERAAQAARADAQAAQAEAERKRAEAEKQRAEEEGLRLAQQLRATKTLRKSLAGLAVVTSLTLASSIVAAWSWQHATWARKTAVENEAVARLQARRADENADAVRASLLEVEQQKKVAIDGQEREIQLRKLAEAAQQEAMQEKNRADEKADLASQNLYFSNMRLAQKAFDDYRSLGRLQSLLDHWVPTEGEKDRRGWEWFYLRALPSRDVLNLPKLRHNDELRLVDWHIPTNRLADGTESGIIRLWDLDASQLLHELKTPKAMTSFWGRKWFDWSPDGVHLAAGFEDSTILIWDTIHGTQVGQLTGLSSPVVSVNYSNDGRSIAACANDGSVAIWNAISGQQLSTFQHPGLVTVGAWSPDNQWYGTSSNRGIVTISSTQTDTQSFSWQAHNQWIYALEWSPDSTRIATSATEPGDRFLVRVWDVATQTEAYGPLEHNHGIMAIAWEPDGKRIATSTMSEEILLWNAQQGTPIQTLRGHLESVCSLAWGKNGELASTCVDGQTKIWSIKESQKMDVIPGNAPSRCVAWNQKADRIASGDDKGQLVVRDTTTWKEICSFQAHQRQGKSRFGFIQFDMSLAWHPDGRRVASVALDGMLKIWDTQTGKETFSWNTDSVPLWSVDWSPDGSRVAVGSDEGSISILDPESHQPLVRNIQADPSNRVSVMQLAFSPDGKQLAASCEDSNIRIWDPVDGTRISEWKGHRGWIFDVAWSPDGQCIASCGSDGNVIVWTASEGKPLSSMRGGQEFMMGVAWNPDGTRIASAQLSGDLLIWDPISGEECLNLRSGNCRLFDVSWSSDGARLAAATSAGPIWVWDATLGYIEEDPASAILQIDRAITSESLPLFDRREIAMALLKSGHGEEAIKAVRKDPLGLLQIAEQLYEKNEVAVADAITSDAQSLLDERIHRNPNDFGSVNNLADLLLKKVDRSIRWNRLRISDFNSSAGSLWERLEDQSIRLAPVTSRENDLYTMTATTDLKTVHAVKLEAMTDDRLPNRGPGLHSVGDFLISGPLFASKDTGQEALVPWPQFSDATTSYDLRMVETNSTDISPALLLWNWRVYQRMGDPQQMIYGLPHQVIVEGKQLQIEMEQGQAIGRFRFSVSEMPDAMAIARRLLCAQRIADPWGRLAAACSILNDQPNLQALLQQSPQLYPGLGDFHASSRDWQSAIECYSKAMPSESPDSDLLLKRVDAYLATQQWEKAIGDCMDVLQATPERAEEVVTRWRATGKWAQALKFGQLQIANHPNDELVWLQIAPIAAMAGDDAYRDFCQRLLAQFNEISDAIVAERVIKTCLLRPDSVDLNTLPTGLLVRAIDDRTYPDWMYTWAWTGRAIFNYRKGDAAKALEYVDQSQAGNPNRSLRLLNLAIAALAYFDTGEQAKSTEILTELQREILEVRATDRNPNHDFLIAELFYNEAQRKLTSSQTAP